MRVLRTTRTATVTMLSMSLLGVSMGGCIDFLGGGLAALPFARITAVQFYDEPSYTIVLSVETAVTDASLVTKVNWVFGDGGGFVEGPAGRTSITHRYVEAGTYEVTAFVFDTTGFIAQINDTVTIVAEDDGGPGPDPAPGDLPGAIGAPNPPDDDEDVAVRDVRLSWLGAENAESYDVYFGDDRNAVADAAIDTEGIFRGSRPDTFYSPTDYVLADLISAGHTLENLVEAGLVLEDLGLTALQLVGIEELGDLEMLDLTVQDLVEAGLELEALDLDEKALGPDTEYFWRVDAVNEAGIEKGRVFSFTTATAPEKAEDPVPAALVQTAPVNQVLTWSAGERTTSHDVYFGRDLDAVTSATTRSEEIYQGNQTATTFDPEDEPDEPDEMHRDGELLPATQYYWRIDEVGPGGTTEGDVWTFTTIDRPLPVSDPVPAHDDPGDPDSPVGIDQILSWQAMPDVESFDVYLGIDPFGVDAATRSSPEFRGNQAAALFDPGLLEAGREHHWRIDTLGPGGTTKGAVFRFVTAWPPPQVAGPFTPADEETGVSVEIILAWDDPGGTSSFDVYLSTDETAVNNGLADAFQGNQDVSETTFDTDGILPDTVYFWRIDSVGPGGTTAGLVLTFRTGVLPAQAEAPVPAIGETGVLLDATLQWGAVDNADGYDVYLGTDAQLVQEADHDSAEFEENVVGATFDPGGLDGDTDYYWRIDPVSAGGTTQGAVWHFQTVTTPGQATEPAPADFATGVALDTLLEWTAAEDADSHDVYFGTDPIAVASATESDPMGVFQGNQATTVFDAAPLIADQQDTTFYWRIDEVDANGNKSTGDLWRFTTELLPPPQAANPSPADGTIGVVLPVTLAWDSLPEADSYDVYFGTDPNVVAAAGRDDPEYMGNRVSNTFSPGTLQPATDYYWRIDTVNDAGTTAGDLWTFTTEP